ncbi:NAD(P)-binding protein [Marasmius fiardii PR-910]|nr:NAD(P)-binding protein [Marasmius fiardii PR-910]
MSDYKRVILVTGANAGIGYEIAKGLAEKGHTVYLAARKEAAGKEAQEKLKKEHNLDVKFVLLDVGDPKSIAAVKDVIEKAEGRLDTLVNNAGISGMGDPQSASEMDMSVLRSVFETNVFGLIQTTTAFIPLLRKAKPGYGTIVQVSMSWASCTYQSRPEGNTTFAAYCSSKTAVNMYSIALANELKKERIRVNCICPGFVTTKLNHYSPGGKTPAQGAKAIIDWSLLGPEDDEKTGKFYKEEGVIPW